MRANPQDACRPYLEQVGRHDTNQRRRFITTYQLWFWMKDENIGFRDRMLQGCPDAVGILSFEAFVIPTFELFIVDEQQKYRGLFTYSVFALAVD